MQVPLVATDFEEAYALGVAASKAPSPNYAVAIAAFKRAYTLDPRRRVSPGRKPDPGLFEVPTRLAAVYRLNGQAYEAQKMYEWVLSRYDSRFARAPAPLRGGLRGAGGHRYVHGR